MWFQKPPLGTPLDWENPLNDNLALHLAMNEGHGDRLQDLSLNGNHGTMQGFSYPPTVASGWNPGQTGRGLNFDETNDYIDCGNNERQEVTGAITLSALVKSTSTPSTVARILSKWSFSGVDERSYQIVFNISDQISFDMSTNGIAGVSTGLYTANINQWYRIIGVFKPSEYLRLYIDGSLMVENTTAIPATIYNSFGNVFIGAADSNGAGAPLRFFPGSIDQPRIVAGAWTAKQCMDYAINPWQVYLDEDD